MDPLTISAVLGGASAVLGKVLPGGGAPAGPAISSAPGGVISGAFNVGGGIGGAGGFGAIGPLVIMAVVAWLVLKK